MTHSRKAISLVCEFEGCRLTSYQDQRGIWTIGYGHTPASENQVCTEEQAEVWLDADLKVADAAVNRLVSVALNQNQFDALVSFVFNVGSGNFRTSTLLRLLNRGESLLAAAEFPKWDHAGAAVSSGLLRRRQAEQALFVACEVLGSEVKHANPA